MFITKCKSRLLAGLCFSCAIFVAGIVYGGEIVSATGAITQGGTLNLTGSGFGNKASAVPIKWETFEEYADNDNIVNKGSAPQWINTGSGISFPKVATTKSHSGAKAIFSDFFLNDNDCSFTHARIEFPQTTDLYASYWIYWDTSTGADIGGNDFFKLSRFNTDVEYSGTPGLKPQFYPDYGIPEGLAATDPGRLEYQVLTDSTDVTKYFNLYSSGLGQALNLTHGSWHRLEMFIRLSDPPGSSGTGAYEFTIDGKPIMWRVGWNQNDDITRVAGENKAFNIFLLEMAGCRYTENARPLMWQDDIYIDNTRARVEIGDKINWSDCTHREIQVPTTWQDGQIQITVNQGSMETLTDKYLFVVDAEGNASQGFSLANVGGEVVRPMPPRDPKMNS